MDADILLTSSGDEFYNGVDIDDLE